MEFNLRLRAVEPKDAELLYVWENDMELWNVSNTLQPFSHYQLKLYATERINSDIYVNKELRLMIELSNKETIGIVDLFDFDPFHNHAGIGILINKKYRNKGYAYSAIQKLIDYSKNILGIRMLYCSITENNIYSIKLFEKCGFHKTGIREKWIKIKDKYYDELFYQKFL